MRSNKEKGFVGAALVISALGAGTALLVGALLVIFAAQLITSWWYGLGMFTMITYKVLFAGLAGAPLGLWAWLRWRR